MAVPLDESHKARLKGHMNREHASELSLYLRAFNGLSTSAAAKAELTDLSLDTLTITSASGTHVVPVTPPMKNFGDARGRLVDMAQRAQTKLGVSDVRITTWTPPEGGGIVSAVGVSFYFVNVLEVAAGLLEPGTTVARITDNVWPWGGAEGYAWLIRALFIPVLAIHVVEAALMGTRKLPKYGVPTFSALWWTWVGNAFVEGYPSFLRLDKMVAAEKKKKEEAKH